MEQFDNWNRMYASRSKKTTFENKACEACYVSEASFREKGYLPSPEISPKIKDIIEKTVEAKEGNIQFDFLGQWISVKDSVLPLKEAKRIEDAEIKRTEVSTILKKIRKQNANDFSILKYFFGMVKAYKSFSIYQLPQHIIEKQKEALGERPSKIYLCKNCGFIKHKIKGSTVRRNKYTYRMYTGLISEKTYCSSYVPRKGSAAKTDGTEKQKIKREIIEERKKKCIRTEVIR